MSASAFPIRPGQSFGSVPGQMDWVDISPLAGNEQVWVESKSQKHDLFEFSKKNAYDL